MVRSFDIPARIQQKTAKYIETLGNEIMSEIVARVVSAIDPEPEAN